MRFFGRVLLVLLLAGLAMGLWHVRHVILLVFGGLIVAVLLLALMQGLQRLLGLGHRWALGVSLLLSLVCFAAFMWAVGDSVSEQYEALGENLPRAVERLRQWLPGLPFGEQILELWDEALEQATVPLKRIAGMAMLTLSALGDLILMILIGVFVALEPGLYRRGIVRLVPQPARERVGRTLDACGDALGSWLKGQAVSMLFVGVATGAGLALLDVPLALILGLFAGLLDFVPYFGPIAAGLLAVLVAFAEGPQTALYVAVLMLAIQQVEGNVLMPMVQRWAVSLPPVLALVAVVVFAGWFGIAGIVFATPLAVVLMVLVRELYVEGVLERGTGPAAPPPPVPVPKRPAD